MAKIITTNGYDRRRELLAALRASILASGASRTAAEQTLSSFFAGLWNEAKVYARQLPTEQQAQLSRAESARPAAKACWADVSEW